MQKKKPTFASNWTWQKTLENVQSCDMMASQEKIEMTPFESSHQESFDLHGEAAVY